MNDVSYYDLFQEFVDNETAPSDKDRKAAKESLRNPMVLRTIAHVLITATAGVSEKVMALDFANPGSAVIAAREQGRRDGMLRFVEELLEFLEEKD